MNSSPPSVQCRYRYDPLDRLTSHVQSDTSQRHRFYCKSRLATEIQGAIGYSIVQHGDLLLAQQQRESGSLDTRLLATDLHRSVLHTLKKNTERQPIAYSPYGHRRGESGLTSLLGFNGERPDPVTGHYLLGNGYRAFNPVLMRFNSPDSLSPFGKGGMNSYAYCSGDPINRADPTGHIGQYLLNLSTKRLTFGKTSWAIRPEVSDVQATYTVDTLNTIGSEVQHTLNQRRQLIKSDIEQNYIPGSTISLKNLSANTINSNNEIDSRQLPSSLQKFLNTTKGKSEEARMFYREITNKDGSLVASHLDDLAGPNHRNSEIYNATIKEFAIAYNKRLSGMDEKIENLLREHWRIRKIAFISDQ